MDPFKDKENDDKEEILREKQRLELHKERLQRKENEEDEQYKEYKKRYTKTVCWPFLYNAKVDEYDNINKENYRKWKLEQYKKRKEEILITMNIDKDNQGIYIENQGTDIENQGIDIENQNMDNDN